MEMDVEMATAIAAGSILTPGIIDVLRRGGYTEFNSAREAVLGYFASQDISESQVNVTEL
ncbi:hypothetical protein A3K63_04950 [Candidatus Micrarchaeota archaeon RBG_16_49_10]|nr:MAG: hypothetical protein A3K63_04950 [Candidatus Micrarchaeota archaeon RBG_16_49_10]